MGVWMAQDRDRERSRVQQDYLYKVGNRRGGNYYLEGIIYPIKRRECRGLTRIRVLGLAGLSFVGHISGMSSLRHDGFPLVHLRLLPGSFAALM